MHTLEQKKESIRLVKDKLRRDMAKHSFEDIEAMSGLLTNNPMLALQLDPNSILLIKMCIGITLAELLIEREEAEASKEGKV